MLSVFCPEAEAAGEVPCAARGEWCEIQPIHFVRPGCLMFSRLAAARESKGSAEANRTAMLAMAKLDIAALEAAAG